MFGYSYPEFVSCALSQTPGRKCLCTCVDKHTSIHMHMHMHMYTYLHMFVYVYVYVFVHVHVYVYVHTYMHTDVYVYTYVYVHVYTPAGDTELSGHAVHAPAPVESLYLPASQAAHVPPLGPVYPVLHSQSSRASLAAFTCAQMRAHTFTNADTHA